MLEHLSNSSRTLDTSVVASKAIHWDEVQVESAHKGCGEKERAGMRLFLTLTSAL
jgi:hypothetical protein